MSYGKTLPASMMALALAACVEAPQSYSSVDQVRSAGSAVAALNAAGGIKINTRPVSATHGTVSDGHISFMNLSYSSEESQILFEAEVALDDSIPAQKIRQEGANVYTYVRPRFLGQYVDHSSNQSYTKPERPVLTDEGLCDGYYVVLGPQNGYRHVFRRSNPIEIRSRTSGMDVGMFGTLGSENWEMTGIDEHYFTTAELSLSPVHVRLGSRILTPCFADDLAKTMWQ